MTFPPGLTEAIIASLIVATGLVGLAFGASGRRSGDRSALWFGLFGCLYGVRLAGHSQLLQPLLPEAVWRYLDASINYAIIVPAGLFVESVLGPGWRRSLRRTWQAVAVFASLAILCDVWRRQPGSAMWLTPPVVLTAGLVAWAHLLAQWRTGSWSREFRVVATGGFIFMGVAAYATLFGEARELEALAMLVFMASVGYFVAGRMLASERRLVAVSRELELARKIQQSLLPRALPVVAGLRVAAAYLPVSDVGGDFYDFDTAQAGHLGVIVADVTGHGVPAALVASMVKIAYAAESERIGNPGLALANINRTFCGRFQGAYVTACCGFIDAVERRLTYSSAGHPAPLLRRKDGRVERLQERGLLLAFDAHAQYASARVDLHEGDRLVFCSDGLVEACNEGDEFFGDARLEHVLAASSSLSPEQFVDRIVTELRGWVGSDTRLQDDVTVVVIDIGERG